MTTTTAHKDSTMMTTALFEQAHWSFRADWELELLVEPTDPEREDIDWARDWLDDFHTTHPHEVAARWGYADTPPVLGYFV